MRHYVPGEDERSVRVSGALPFPRVFLRQKTGEEPSSKTDKRKEGNEEDTGEEERR